MLFEHDRGLAGAASYQAFGFARSLVDAGIGSEITAVLVGAEAATLAGSLGAYGVGHVICVVHDELSDYAPEAWGEVMASLAAERGSTAVVAVGTDRGNEVMAHVGAIADLPFAANVVGATTDGADLAITRVRWGGSLLEQARLQASRFVLSSTPFAYSGEPFDPESTPPTVETIDATLSKTAGRTRIVDRVTIASGITLTTAAVVVSGGRGVGSADGFAVLEELAGLLGGAVGCSRVATNNGWRPHRDQVGQTGKRIAPDLYIACGISGAIQHWVGMMSAKHVLAINTDGQSNMVGKADYAVIGDLHEIVPAVIAEIIRRRG